MLLLVTESLPSCSSGGPPEEHVFAVRLTHIIAVLDSLLLLLSRGQSLLLLLFGSMPSSPVGRIRFMLHMLLLEICVQCMQVGMGRQASFLVSLLAGNPEFPFFIL